MRDLETFLANRLPPLLLILLLGVLLWGGEYVRRDLWAPDEARFALVSKEMREGHWLVPYRQGEFYTHKPPLMFWLTNLFSLLTGGQIGNVAPRLPSFLGATLALWSATRLAARWFSPAAAWWTLLVLPSSFLFWNKGGFGQIDMLLCGLQMMALYFLFTATRTRHFVFAYVFMGLGILAKGPVGFLVPWGVFIAARLTARDPQPHVARHHWLWGPLITLAFPAIWLSLAWWQGAPEGFFPELLFHQNVGRVAGEFGGHLKPFYYFLYYFPLDFLPWTLLLPLAYAAMSQAPVTWAARRRLLAWILFVIVFFSLSASKRNLYILLAYPAAAIFIAGSIPYWRKLAPAWRTRTAAILGGLLTILAAGMIIGAFIPNLPFPSIWLLPGGLLLAAGLVFARRAYRDRPESPAWLAALAGAVLATFASIGALVYPAFDDLKTPDELIATAQELLGPEDRLLLYNMQGEIFSLYTERKGYMAMSDEDFLRFLQDSPQTNHVIVLLERHRENVQRLLGEAFQPGAFSSGGKKILYVTLRGNQHVAPASTPENP
ncbi:MAG TPA: glycosyltransferase family 39 protein [Kiritimatiellia bacterium]|nr:glycosyltransferase family 39 protein [Kiritimatiellia bacterium]